MGVEQCRGFVVLFPGSHRHLGQWVPIPHSLRSCVPPLPARAMLWCSLKCTGTISVLQIATENLIRSKNRYFAGALEVKPSVMSQLQCGCFEVRTGYSPGQVKEHAAGVRGCVLLHTQLRLEAALHQSLLSLLALPFLSHPPCCHLCCADTTALCYEEPGSCNS